MAKNDWFESVAQAQQMAKKKLPASVYNALLAGSEKGISYRDNTEAFSELGLAPHIANLSSQHDLSTTFMGRNISFPVVISPAGVQAIHPDGEVALARAAASRGTGIGLSSFASKSMEDVVEANPGTYFQMYWMGSKDSMLLRMERARRAGVAGLIVTLDWSFSHSRDWGSPSIPDTVDIKTMLRFAPEVLQKPKWLLQYLKHGHLPTLTTPNLSEHGKPAPRFFGAYGEWAQTPPPTWEDITWLRETWGGPFMLKGISRIDDARRAVAAGVSTISVSNHGGNNLDGTPASIRFLPGISGAVGTEIEIVLDGGIRRGSDVIKALALGAKVVMIGRAPLWGLAANGQAGVENVLDILRNGIDSALLALGHSSVHDLTPSDVIMQPNFLRQMG